MAGDAPACAGRVIVSHDTSDDAAIVQLPGDDRRALVLTTDVIAPIVDDPEAFGEIAAVNAVSDVFAMGGRPLWALNLAFFPDDKLPLDVLDAILRGGARACARMGVAIVGGHTVRDSELKYGLAVTGDVEPDRVLSNQGARAGQALVLTKPLGTGVVGQAIKQGEASDDEIAAAIASMTASNGVALEVARRFAVSAATDVTGFGLLGHLRNTLRGSHLAAVIEMNALPLLAGARRHAEAGRVPGGSRANLAFLGDTLRISGAEDGVITLLAADAQTSGGLLLCVDAGDADSMVIELRAAGCASAGVVGRLRAPRQTVSAHEIELRFGQPGSDRDGG